MGERGVNKDAQAIVVCIAPDVCYTPQGGALVSVPYTISSKFDASIITAPTVNYGSFQAFPMQSRLPTVIGDEPGTGGGIVSGVNLGYCRPVEHSGTVRAQQQFIVRHGDLMLMNCSGPDGPANTYGRIIYVSPFAVAGQLLQRDVKVTTDKNGKTTVETREVVRDPRTGAVTETQQRTTIDPKTGRVDTEQYSVTRDPMTGASSCEHSTGQFDPASNSYQFNQQTGSTPGLPFDGRGPVLGNEEIGKLQPDGSVYLGDGIYAPPESLEGGVEPGPDLGGGGPEPLPEPDPEYEQALQEEAQTQAEIDAINEEMKWEAAETAADVAGLVDPSPASDTVAAGLALRRGDVLGAGLNLLSWIPYMGDAIGKPIKGVRAAKRLAKLMEKLKALSAKLDKIKDKLKRKKPEAQKNPDTPNGSGNNGGHIPRVRRVIVKEGKWDYFFGAQNPTNTTWSVLCRIKKTWRLSVSSKNRWTATLRNISNCATPTFHWSDQRGQ